MSAIFRLRPSILRQPLLKSRSIFSPFSTASFPKRNYPALIPKMEHSPVPKRPYHVRTGTVLSVIDKDLLLVRFHAPPNYAVVKSDEEYKAALSKAKGESVPTVFYYSAEKCEDLTGAVKEMAHRYSHVSVFKLDVDEEGIASSVLAPTIQFFRDGKKMGEVVGQQHSESDMSILMEAVYVHNIDLSCLSSPPSNYVLLKSGKEFGTAISNAEGASVPTVFYISYAKSLPCLYLPLALKELAHRLPQVVVYQVDVVDDLEEGIVSALKKLNVTMVPTIQFFKDGKKEGEIVADPKLNEKSAGEIVSHYVSAVREKMYMLYH